MAWLKNSTAPSMSLSRRIGNPKAPFLNRMARRYRVATQFYAPGHPSLPNYLAMISGSTHGCGSDRCRGGAAFGFFFDFLNIIELG